MAENVEYDEEANSFDYEDIKKKVEGVIEQTLQTFTYSAKKVHEWSTSVSENCIKTLQQTNKPFKYVVTCIIMQKSGAGLHTASACFWDANTDRNCSVRWSNKTMHCIVTVFGMHL